MIRVKNPIALFLCCMFLGTALPPSSAGKSEIAVEERCKEQETRNNAIKLTIFSTKNETGDWTTSFVADQGLEMNTTRVNLALQRTLIECEGKPFLRTEGILQEFNSESSQQDLLPINETEILTEEQPCDCKVEDLLKFDSELKSAKVVISEDGRTAHRTTPKEDDMQYGNLITHRVLREEEMFQLKIEETVQEGHPGLVAIGLAAVIPADIKTTCHISDSQKGTWVARNDYIMNDSNTIKSNYQLDLRNLTVGTIFGVMRKKNGDLHFYKDGNDMGLAATALPPSMYGIFDLRDYITKVSIADECSCTN